MKALWLLSLAQGCLLIALGISVAMIVRYAAGVVIDLALLDEEPD